MLSPISEYSVYGIVVCGEFDPDCHNDAEVRRVIKGDGRHYLLTARLPLFVPCKAQHAVRHSEARWCAAGPDTEYDERAL